MPKSGDTPIERRSGFQRRGLDRRKNALEAFKEAQKVDAVSAFEKRATDRRSGDDRRKQ